MHEPSTARTELFDALVQHGVLSAHEAAGFQFGTAGDERPPLGRILISEGLLSIAEVMHVVGLQIEYPDLLIGEIAVREGYCTTDDIDHCLDIQQRLLANPIELLLTRRDVEPRALVRALTQYIGTLEQALDAREGLLSSAA